jgi:hypothetical protein
VGLELRPRRLRDASTVWGAMAQQHGASERDRLWSHPDLLPTSEDLDEPLDFVARQGKADPFAELTRGLDDSGTEQDDTDGDDPAPSS